MEQPTGPRRIERSTDDRWVAGVCGGLAEHFGQPAWVFRLLFVAATLVGGAGIVAYALMWLFLPLAPESGGGSAAVRTASSWDLSGLLGFISLGLGALLALNALGVPVRVSVWAPLILIGGGVVVLWRQGDEAQRALAQPGPDVEVSRRPISDGGIWARVLVGLALLVLGVVLFVGPRITLASAAQALVATGAVLAGVVVITLPWVSAWSKRRQAERYAAVRNEERAAMAARVHDSVLQTLTLIQRRADDPREVARLARAEERALRSWLYAPVAASGTLAAALAEVVTATEADYDARIDLVTVGDAVVDDRVAALIAATREAVLNAAKHADAPASVYAEVTDGEVEVNVKDRGRGFDPETISEDRHGVRESIVARMEAVGGRAVVRSVPGEGTEVRLLLPCEVDRG
jgi:signal transduction histidine kinase/phage shock protein PspC (stress-responsive transcriptional regulator)